MPKSSKRQHLTKEERLEENRKLRREIASKNVDKEAQQHIVNILSTQNLIAYVMVLLLPPVGIWYVWTRREKLDLNFNSVILWTIVGCAIMFQWIRYFLLH
ncbi:MAG: hypothetical protein K6A40_05660 [Solobacterium sp.]|nr:hypothetical protein [Solobacterium sp.]